MQELHHVFATQGFEVDGVNLTAAAAAAAVLLERGLQQGDLEEDDGELGCAGTLVGVKFQFTTKQEWLVPGMRFVVRDQQGHVSGVGVVHGIGHGCW